MNQKNTVKQQYCSSNNQFHPPFFFGNIETVINTKKEDFSSFEKNNFSFFLVTYWC